MVMGAVSAAAMDAIQRSASSRSSSTPMRWADAMIDSSACSGVVGSVMVAPSSGLVVDLGSLQAAGVVDIDRFPLREGVQRRVTRLAVAVAGLPRAPEWQVGLGADGAGIDIQ